MRLKSLNNEKEDAMSSRMLSGFLMAVLSSTAFGYGMSDDDGVLNASAVGSGSTSGLHVNVTIFPNAADVGLQGAVFLGARLPSLTGGNYQYFYYSTSRKGYVSYDGNQQHIEPFARYDGGVPSVVTLDAGMGQDWCSNVRMQFFVGVGVLDRQRSMMVQMAKEGRMGRVDPNTGIVTESVSPQDVANLSGRASMGRGKLDPEQMALTFVQNDGIRGKKYRGVYSVGSDWSCQNNNNN